MMLRKVTVCLLAVAAAFFVAGSSAQTPKAPTGFVASSSPISLSVAGLHVCGNRICNGLGQAVQLRGVNKSSAQYMALGQFSTTVFDSAVDAAEVAAMAAWGINAVRIPLNEHCWLGINGCPVTPNYTAAQYRQAVIDYANLLTAAGIAPIPELQWAAPGTNLATPVGTNQVLIPMPDADHAPAFWTSVANTFKSNSSVIFNLFNEPYPDNNGDTTAAWTCLRDGCASIYPKDGSTYTGVGMQSLVNTIRATGSTNIIMSPGVQFTNALTQWLIYKPIDSTGNLVADWHSYAGQTCSNQACFDANVAPVLASVPLITGEIGENDCQHVYIDPLMVWLDAHYGNYLAWDWNVLDCSGEPALISAYDGTPTSYGVGLRDHLLALRGSTPPAPPVVPLFTNTYPFGIAVGSSTDYTAVDGTVYHADVATTGLALSMQFFPTYSAVRSISGTSDPTLYQHGRYGQFGTWDVGVLNGTYQITLSIAPATAFTQSTVNDPSTASINNAGEFGQDQTIQGNKPPGATCAFSQYVNGNNSPYSTPATACPATGGSAPPAVDTVSTVTYTVDVFNQHLSIQPAASFGGGRKTILNAIKVAQQSTPSVPTTPTGLSATGANGLINLAWTASGGATTYNVYRGTAARGFYRLMAAPSTNAYVDTAVVNGKTYYYIISAANSAGASAKTASVNASPALAIPSSPTAPGASAGNTQVVVSWTASSGATSYHVKRSTTSGSGYSTVGSPSSSPFIDTGRTNGTSYFYVVTALNAAGESSNSSQVSATPQASGTTGVWSNVTPGGITLDPTFCSNGNFGVETVGADTAHAGTLYAMAHCQGIFKSTDYGQSWAGPINTGANGANVTNCGGGITVVPNGASPILYEACIRGNPGLWKSTDGGVNWSNVPTVPPLPSGRPDIYPVVADPYNGNHILVAGHEQNFLLESTNGGSSWTSLAMPAGMQEAGGTAFIFFLDTANAATTAKTWLWMAQQSGGVYGTWKTTDQGATWTQVSANEHPHGDSQIFQPNTTGTVFMAGAYASCGWGVLRSTDYGSTWSCVGNNGNEGLVWGTPSKVYAAYGWSTTDPVNPSFECAALPGTTGWTACSGAPSTFNGGPHEVAVVNDGTHNIFVGAMGSSGLWRYIEP